MIEEIVRRIDKCLSRPGMNKVLLAELSGIHRNALENFDQPGWNPQVKSLDKIIRVVGLLEGLPEKEA